MKLYDRIFPPKRITLSNGKTVLQPRSRLPMILLLFVSAMALSIRITGANLSILAERGHEFFSILGQMIPPNTNYISKIWEPLLDTIKMSLLGSLIGSTMALPFAVAASTNIIKSKAIVTTLRLISSIVRTLPTLVIALLATYMFGLGAFAGTVAISIFTFGIVMKMLYEQIETVDMGAFEAVEALGGTKVRSFMSAVMPQILSYYLSTCIYCFEINVRYASILGYVGAGGIGLILKEKIGWREYSEVGMILLMLYVTVFILENIGKALRRKLA